jgi:PAS domain S-box-containing protein
MSTVLCSSCARPVSVPDFADPPEQSYRLLFEKNPHPMYVVDWHTLAFLAVNEAAVRHYGYSREEFLALTARDIRPPEELSRFLCHVHEAANRDSQFGPWPEGVWKHRKKDGTIIVVEIASSRILFQGRDAALVLAADITGRLRSEEALRESEERHRLISELTTDYAYTCSVDADGTFTITSVTEGFSHVTGYTLAELQARGGWAALIHPQDLPKALQAIPRLLSGQRSVEELRICTRNGEVRWIRYSTQPTWDPAQGRVVGLVGAVQDISQRKRTEDSLQQTNQVLASIVHASPLAIIAIDPNECVTTWNPAAERIFGWPMEEVLGRPLPIIPPDSKEEFRAIREVELRGEIRSGAELRRLRQDGSLVDVSVWTAPVLDAEGSVFSTIGIVADITARKQAEAQLREQAGRLRELSSRLLEVQEQERRHLARELHDEIGQQLTALQYALRLSEPFQGEEVRAYLSGAGDLVKDLIGRVRDISLKLRPSMLDDLGLLPALLWHVNRYTAQTGVRVQFEHRSLDRRLYPREVETAAFRIVQEALTNIARHAKVKEATVCLWREQDCLHLRVEDRGSGFELRGSRASESSGGLSGMRERAELLGGRLNVESAQGGGTSVTAELPIQDLEERRQAAFERLASE